MAKIIKLDFEDVVIANDDKTIIRVAYADLDFKPQVGDLVEVYPDGEFYIIHKVSAASQIEDKININIVNENNASQQVVNNNGGIYGGKLVNKWLYVLLALFLGGLGIHKFYSGNFVKGVLYFVFSWTFIPSLLALFTAIGAALKPADQYGNILVVS